MKTRTRHEKLLKERRVVRVPVTIELMAMFFVDGTNRTVATGLPKDVVFLSASYQPDMMACNFFYAHETFEQVPEGAVVPVQMVTIVDLTAKEALAAIPPQPRTRKHNSTAAKEES